MACCLNRGAFHSKNISYTFGKNPFVFKKNPSKIRMNPFVLKKSRTLFPINELPLGLNQVKSQLDDGFKFLKISFISCLFLTIFKHLIHILPHLSVIFWYWNNKKVYLPVEVSEVLCSTLYAIAGKRRTPVHL